MNDETNWLDEGSAQPAREKAHSAALDFARLHQIFVTDERGKQLLEYWRQAAATRVPVNATIDQYARAEQMRTFVQVIDDQIRFSMHDGRIGN